MAGEVSAKKKALLGKIDITPGTDPVPTGAANATRIISATPNLDLSPIEQKVISQTFGNLQHGVDAKGMGFDVELFMRAGGTPGTSPDWAPIAHCSGHVVTVNAGTSVVIAPTTPGVGANRRTATFYLYADGLEYKFISAVCSKFSIDAKIGDWLRCKATLLAPYLAPTAVAIPGTLTYQTTAPIKVGTSDVITEGGTAISVGSWSFDAGVSASVHRWIGAEEAQLDDRAKPAIALSKRSLATAADIAAFTGQTQAIFNAQFGAAGNRVTFNAPKASYESLKMSEDGMNTNRDIGLVCYQTNGDDAYSITLT